MYSKDNITLGEGRGNAFIMFLEEGKEEKIAEMLKTPNNNPEPSEEAITLKGTRKAKQYAVKAAGRR